MKENRKTNLLKLTECAIMLALATVLSFIKIIQMPMGGAVTLCSMLPIMLIGIKYGNVTGACVGLMYSLLQLVLDLPGGNVFYAGMSAGVVIVVALFDYLVPFTALGFAGMFRKLRCEKLPMLGAYIGVVVTIVIRFACHFITGFSIWGQWAPEGMGKYYYSLVYNGTYLLPELGITLVVAVLLLQVPQMRKLLINNNKNK